MTVTGPVQAADAGRTLVHEHILCDFIGAAGTGRHRYDPEAVVAAMLPHLKDLRDRGFNTFIDCTPAYIGRDPRILERLSGLSGLRILTNTGYYGAAGDKFLPPHAFTESANQLAARWVEEWEKGIEGTSIRPGFMKIGVDGGPLSEVDRKLVQAAARAHVRTGLAIACHTGEGAAALGVLETAVGEGIDPGAVIIVHADGIADPEVHLRLARAGAWVEYDGIGGRPIEDHVRLIAGMREKGCFDRLLLSHDAGWFSAGEPDGAKGKIRPFTAIPDRLLPALRAAGFSDTEIDKLLVEHPRAAFAIRGGDRKRPQ